MDFHALTEFALYIFKEPMIGVAGMILVFLTVSAMIGAVLNILPID